MVALHDVLANWIIRHLHPICLAIVATCLAIFSNDINRQMKRLVGRCHFLVRFVLYVLLCAFGYGLMIVTAAFSVQKVLLSLDRSWLVPLVLLAFATLGFLAERRNHI